jgi:hypothetical protein
VLLDDWLASIDDKENKVPNAAGNVSMDTSQSDLVTPRLSDPMAEFDDDVEETEGVEVEGLGDLPEIKNEVSWTSIYKESWSSFI